MQKRKNEATYQDKYKRWRIKVQRNGEIRYFYSVKPGHKGKIEAERKADDWLALGNKTDMRVNTLCQLYLDNIDTGHSRSHLDKESSVIKNWILPYWQHRKVATLTNLDYKDAIYRPAATGRSKRTCGHVRSVIMALYKTAKMAKIDMEAPYGLTLPKSAPTQDKHIFNKEEFAKLLSAREDYWYINAFRLIALLGLRRGELCALKKTDLAGNQLMICRSATATGEITTGKTAAASRTIFLPQIAQDVLAAQLRQITIFNSPWLFPDQTGHMVSPNNLYKRWRYLCNKLNLPPISLHELRHTMISMAKDDVAYNRLQAVVGHSPTMDTFRVYAHTTQADAETAAAELNALYAKIIKGGIESGTIHQP